MKKTKIPMWEKLDMEDNKIYRFFRMSAEPYDDLEWDGKILNVWLDDELIETYTKKDLIECEIL